MKTILLLPTVAGLLLLPSCLICNTSGKLDAVGKTQTRWHFTEQPHLYYQNDKYYIKGEAYIWETSAKTITVPWNCSTSLINPERASGIGYHQITIPKSDLNQIHHSQATKGTSNKPIPDINFHLTPDTPWISATAFERTPFRTTPLSRQNTKSLAGDLIDTENHRTTGNILRIPMVTALFVVDIPGSIVVTLAGYVDYAIREA